MKMFFLLLLFIASLNSVCVYAQSSSAFEADYLCEIKSDSRSNPKTLYRIAALNPEFTPLATQLIVVKHDPKSNKQKIIAFARKISVTKFVSPQGYESLRFQGIDQNKKVALNVFNTPYGVKAHAEFGGGSGPNMDCETSTTIIIEN